MSSEDFTLRGSLGQVKVTWLFVQSSLCCKVWTVENINLSCVFRWWINTDRGERGSGVCVWDEDPNCKAWCDMIVDNGMWCTDPQSSMQGQCLFTVTMFSVCHSKHTSHSRLFFCFFHGSPSSTMFHGQYHAVALRVFGNAHLVYSPQTHWFWCDVCVFICCELDVSLGC